MIIIIKYNTITDWGLIMSTIANIHVLEIMTTFLCIYKLLYTFLRMEKVTSFLN